MKPYGLHENAIQTTVKEMVDADYKLKSLLRCALADLQGALQAKEQGDYNNHDWEAHEETIAELEAFLNDNKIPY